MKTLLSRTEQILSGPALLNYTLPILMLYLVCGTIAQKYIGLYEATQMFFSDFIFWLGPMPMPGMPVFMVLIFINLGFKLIFKSPWVLKNAGIIITHIGAILLMGGGLLTAAFSSEGYMDIVEGSDSAFVNDYHMREFVLLDENGHTIERFTHHDLNTNTVLSLSNIPVKITILETCRNCQITAREEKDDSFVGMAQHMQLSDGPLEMQNEENMAGLTFSVEYKDTKQTHVVLENVPQLPEVTHADSRYKFMLRKIQRPLPFSIELVDFKKELHPGTAVARTYSSHIRVHDEGAVWDSVIRMNEPLRYKGYTFFQSSFLDTPNGEVSVLAVVWNVGRAFPYISGIVMCIGIIVHLFVRRRYSGQYKGTPHA